MQGIGKKEGRAGPQQHQGQENTGGAASFVQEGRLGAEAEWKERVEYSFQDGVSCSA